MRHLLLRLARQDDGTIPAAYSMLGATVSLTTAGLGMFYQMDYILRLFVSQLQSLF